MSGRRLQGTRSTTRKANHPELKTQRFLGLSLGGGKSHKTCVAIIEYYPEFKKVFLTQLQTQFLHQDQKSADFHLVQFLKKQAPFEALAIDAPLQLPKCLRCKLKCPGYEACKEPEIRWFWSQQKKHENKKNPEKIFTPYTERCVDHYLNRELEEGFSISHALGANAAPLAARALFLQRQLKSHTLLEVVPRVSVWRIGRELKLSKHDLRTYRQAVTQDFGRNLFLNALTQRDLAFIYEQDHKLMLEQNHAFEAFVSAFTALLSFKKLCDKRPKGFPKQESWVELPAQGFLSHFS